MAFFKITYNRFLRQANLYGRGCNFSCSGCSYKVNPGLPEEPRLSPDTVRRTLERLDVARVHFLGGEPTLNPDLPEIAEFAGRRLGAYTKIGHCNGSGPPARYIDAMSISIKAFTEDIHVAYTGVSNDVVLRNFAEAYAMGIELDAASVLIPGCIDGDELEKVAAFVSGIDQGIPYRIIGFVPPPGSPWRGPSVEEMDSAVRGAEKHLRSVSHSLLSGEDLQNRRYGGISYRSTRVA